MRPERMQGRSLRAGQADLPKTKPDLKKIWPEIWALVAPRKGLLLAGLGLMVVNRGAGLVLPIISKPLLDTVLSPQHARPDLLLKVIALVLSATILQAM